MYKIFNLTRIKIGMMLAVLALALLSTVLIFRPTTAAGSATITLSPSSGTYTTGATISVTVTFNGSGMYGGQADLSYDQSKLQYVSIDVGSSAFGQGFPSSGGSGSVSIARTVQGTAVSGSRVLAKVNFKMLASSGTASVSVKDSSSIYDGTMGDIWNHSLATASFTAQAPSSGSGGDSGGSGGSNNNSNPRPSNTGGSNNSSGGSGSNNNTPPPSSGDPDPSPAPSQSSGSLTVKSPTHEKVEFTRATISATLDKPAKVRVEYSFTKDDKTLTFVTPEVNASGKFSLPLDPANLVPGTTYTYQIVANDGSAEVKTDPQTFTTTGYTVQVLIKDQNEKIAKNTEVTLHSEPQTTKTDDEGVAVFKNVAPGEHRVEVKSGGKVLSASINVADTVTVVNNTQTAEPQDFAVALDGNLSAGLMSVIAKGGGLIAIVGLVAGVVVLLIRRRNASLPYQSVGSATTNQSSIPMAAPPETASTAPAPQSPVVAAPPAEPVAPAPVAAPPADNAAPVVQPAPPQTQPAPTQTPPAATSGPGQVIAPQTQDPDNKQT